MRQNIKRAVVVGTALAVTTGAGAAYAAWIASGTGSATAKATAAQALSTLDASAVTTADLYPGADGDVVLKISNPNAYPVRITRVAGNGAITAKNGIGTCSVTGVSFTDQTNVTLDVAANNSATFTFTGAAHMSNLSEDGCQGATFVIPVSLSGASNAA